ncbi:MAG: transporter, permease component [Crocinitomicaceae bacterium]|jgi:phospholipid/cholesterol/gamma-HCH transport system substrate-binding protein|nr:transporter, permease component [Crocinitomicaceae bacterium]
MSEPVNKRGITVGIFIVIGIAFLVGAVLTIGNLRSTFQQKMTIWTIFDDVNGLQAGNNIWFSGVKIGTVKEMELYGRSQVKVTLNISLDAQKYIRKNSMAKIGTDGLIGNKIIVIYGGTPDSPQVEEGDRLANEALLSTDDILETVQQNNLNILKLTEQLASGQGTIGKLIQSDSLYRSIANTARSIELASADARNLISSLSHFSQEMNQFGNKLNQKGTLVDKVLTDTVTYTSVRRSVRQLERTMDTISSMVSQLKAASENPKSPVGVLLYDEETGKDVKETIRNLEKSSDNLNQDLEALKHSFLLRRYFKKKAKEEEQKK